MSISVSSHFKYYLENNHSDGNRPNLTKFCKKSESSIIVTSSFQLSIFSLNHSFDLSILFSSGQSLPFFSVCLFICSTDSLNGFITFLFFFPSFFHVWSFSLYLPFLLHFKFFYSRRLMEESSKILSKTLTMRSIFISTGCASVPVCQSPNSNLC